MKSLIDFLFPNRCLACDKIIDSRESLCKSCEFDIPFSYYNYGEEHIFLQKCRVLFPVENAFALMLYGQDSLSQKIIHHLKYKGRENIAYSLVRWVIERIDFQSDKPDLIVPMPIHTLRKKERGYNQLHLFSKILSQNYEIPVDNQFLIREKYTKAQAKKSKAERETFVNPFVLQRREFSQKHILLIDDVFTTGKTMSMAVGEILRKANCKVSVLVFAVEI